MSLKKLEEEIKNLQGTFQVLENGDEKVIELTAPPKRLFSATGDNFIQAEYNDESSRNKAVKSLLKDLQDGLFEDDSLPQEENAKNEKNESSSKKKQMATIELDPDELVNEMIEKNNMDLGEMRLTERKLRSLIRKIGYEKIRYSKLTGTNENLVQQCLEHFEAIIELTRQMPLEVEVE